MSQNFLNYRKKKFSFAHHPDYTYYIDIAHTRIPRPDPSLNAPICTILYLNSPLFLINVTLTGYDLRPTVNYPSLNSYDSRREIIEEERAIRTLTRYYDADEILLPPRQPGKKLSPVIYGFYRALNHDMMEMHTAREYSFTK